MTAPQYRDDQRQDAPPQQARPPQRRCCTPRRAGYIASGACALSMIATALAGCGSPATTYRASVLSYTAPSPGQLDVYVHVTNTGKAAGTPTCTVSATYQSGGHGGSDGGTLGRQLAPGKSSVLYVEVVLPGTVANGIANVSANC